MKKLILLMTVVFTTVNFIHAQIVGTPNANIAFSTNPQAKLLAHVQSNNSSDLGNFSKQWIGIGQPLNGLYGFRVQSNNNAGILALTGTTPDKKLELNWGGPNKTANFEINQITSFTNPSGKINRFTIKTNGNVGIGTNNPPAKLAVVSAIGQRGLESLNPSGNSHFPWTNGWSYLSGQGIVFRTNGNTERMRIKPDGNVGIGTNAPNWKLHVGVTGRNGILIDGNDTGDAFLRIENGGGSHYIFDDDDNTHALDIESANDLAFNTNGSNEQMRIKENGRVGIGRTGPSYKLDVNGTTRATSFVTSSDKRFKKDIKGIDNALDKINALDGFTYKFKEEKIGEYDFSRVKGEKQLGFLAQDVKKVFPELVSEDEDGYLSVNYIGLIPVLVEGMKEQQQVVTEQEKEIADLQSRLEKLEALLNASAPVQGNLSTPTENTATEGVVLRQNAPNPFSNSTTIEYQLPERLASASLVVSDLNGRTIANYNISGKGTVQFNTGELDSGVYTYTIIANGQNIAAQKMVIQK